ncbi:M3 family metallopeptidase [Duganella violaceipulchra]|uniref:oligopeptidase A n=1 Tax=Duganella violaceipulchra TaxID=2849652 RepID=A0AA41HCU3_9BURK|nr:M3 family metallopeptidase [Duganella violaceicalia]MBV6321428.1 M3 family metallopeptidase [Duganella violaceicalia]MCP2009323.1 oligopeptidase A [Duganella violaceicalia]
MTADNPLLDFSGLPRFDAIKPEHVTPAIASLLAKSRAVVEQLEAPSEQVTWDNFVMPLENATELLGRAWGIVSHLNNVVDTPELRATYNDNQPKVTEFWTALAQNEALFGKYKALRASAGFDSLSPARKRIIDNAVRDFRMGGAELPADKKERFADIQEEHASVSTRFSENVLDATNDYKLLVADEADLAGLPADVKAAARAAAEKENKQGYEFSLHFPSYFPILQFADKRELRETIYRANATKASEQGDVFSKKEDWDNTQNIVTLLKLRDEEAKLLGYKNFAEVSLVPKMAQSPDQVIAFLEDLAKRARPFAEQDLAELKKFAQDELGIAELKAWDIPYASEKLQERRYAFSAQEVKQYFPEHKVVDGLFRLIQNLFTVEIKPDHAPVWHKDVRFYRIERNGKLIGQFYLDLYARAGKSGGAWMDDARGRRAEDEKIQTPVAYLTCNFTEPAVVDGVAQPSLFTHDEVITLFHEFGHGLHHMLTQVDELGVSGISGVEWDAVELPSQFMENFCWEWEVLEHMTSHVSTGEPLPRALYDKMLAAKNFQSGLQTLRQVEFSLLDMHLHYDYDASTGQTVQQLIDEVRAKFALIVPPAFNRFQNSFGHIFSGGYAAGYYSYKWAEVLSADAYAAFEEAKALGPEATSATGKRYLQEILSVGGSRPALESFTAFRGREPSIDALLRHSGMAA